MQQVRSVLGKSGLSKNVFKRAHFFGSFKAKLNCSWRASSASALVSTAGQHIQGIGPSNILTFSVQISIY